MLATIRLSADMTVGLVWGNGHTVETDPTRHGWLCRKAWPVDNPAYQVYMVGQRGVAVCATVRTLGDGRLDVALYDETPEQVVAAQAKGSGDRDFQTVFSNARYDAAQDAPGWGLAVIEMIEQERRYMAQDEALPMCRMRPNESCSGCCKCMAALRAFDPAI